MRRRLPLILSATALAIAILGSTPLGQAAGNAIANAVPLAKVANFAKNAGRLSGHKASPNPKAGQIPVVGPSGMLPTSILPASGGGGGSTGSAGPSGPAGPAGPAGATGPSGPSGAAGLQLVFATDSVPASATNEVKDVACPSGKVALAGGSNPSSPVVVFASHPLSAVAMTGTWEFRISNPTASSSLVGLYVICATNS